MSDRKCVLLLIYDLPNETGKQRSDYYHFRKSLMRDGYVKLQKSAYIRLLKNVSSAAAEIRKIRLYCPAEGTVNVIQLSLAQFRAIETVLGEPFPMDLFTDDLIIF